MRRGLALLPKHGHALLVVDEGAAGATNTTLNMHWHLHTFANVTADSDKPIVLLQSLINGTHSEAEVVFVSGRDCPGASITVSEVVNGPDPNASGWKDLGARRLTITAPAHSCKQLAVVIGAGAASWGANIQVHPLDQWEAVGPVQ